MERERQHVRVGGWQGIAKPEPADPGVLGQPAGVDLEVRQLELEIGHRAAAAGQERELAAARNRADRGSREQRQGRG